MLFSDVSGTISNQPPMVSFLDHGFLFGDSLYEVVRLYDRKFLGWDEHMDRFKESGRRTGIDIQSLLADIRKRSIALLSELGEPNAAIRIIVTRGIGRLHIDWRSCEAPQIFMAAWKFDKLSLPKSLKLAVTKIRRNSIQALDPAIKSGNYLNSILAFKEAVEYGFDDAILLNTEGYVTELTTMNLGWVSDASVVTPETSAGILHGVTRKILLGCSSVKEGRFTERDLRSADEVFVLSTFKEILPVSELRFSDGQIKEFRNFEKTLELQKVLRGEIEKRLSRESVVF